MQAYGPDYKSEVTSRRTTVAFLQEAGIKLRQYQDMLINMAKHAGCVSMRGI